MKQSKNIVLAGAMLILALAACAAPNPAATPGAAPAAKKTIAFSPLALSIPALKGLSEGVKGVGAAQGYDVIVLDPKFDAAAQAQQLNELIGSGRINGAWVIAVNPGSMKAVVEAAQQKKVVLVLNGVPEDYGLSGMQTGVTFARINYEEFGGAVGQSLGECINAKLGGKAKVIFLQQAEGTAGKKAVEDNMQSKLKAAAPGAEIVATDIIKDRPEAQTKVGQLLQAHPDANAVMAPNDEGALGALGAFKAAGKELPCLTEGGGNEEVLGLVKSGVIYSSSALQFEADLMQTFDSLATMLKDPAAKGKQTQVPLKVIKAP
jgi:ABC-type sugar transport system substrate-binding protein